MSNLHLKAFLIGLVVLMLASCVQPIKGWMRDFLEQKRFLAFMLPLLILFGWPMENVESFRAGADLGWQRIARIIIFIGFFCFYLFEIIIKKEYRVPASVPLVLFFLYSIYAGISSLYSPEPMQTAWKAFELIVVLIFGISLYQGCKNSSLNTVSLVNAMVYIAFALCLMSIVGGFVAPEIAWRDWGLLGFGQKSMAGVAPMINPNMLGQLGAIVCLMGIAGLLKLKKAYYRGNLFVFLIGLSALFLAYSRTSIISTIVLAVIVLVLLRKTSMMVLSLPVMAVIGVLFAEFVMTYLARGQSNELFFSMSGRVDMWEAALKSWRSSPWFGEGFFVGHKYVQLESGSFLLTVDNTYIETLVNLGVLGCVIIITFALTMLMGAYKLVIGARACDKKINFAAIAIFIFISVTIVRSLTASSFQVLHYSLLFVIVALIVILAMKRSIKNYRMRR